MPNTSVKISPHSSEIFSLTLLWDRVRIVYAWVICWGRGEGGRGGGIMT